MKNNHANIALYGFMGSGKSTIGRLLSEILNISFFDLDLQIEEKYDMGIVDMFKKYGEDVFRDREATVLTSLERAQPHVLALGGGALLRKTSEEYVGSKYRLFTLCVPFSVIQSRLNTQTRPLASQAKQLYKDRHTHYQNLGRVIQLTEETPQECVALILEDLRAA